MALLNFGGFELGAAVEEAQSGGTISWSTTTVRTGTYALRVNPTTTGTGFAAYQRTSTSGGQPVINQATNWIRFYFRYATKPAAADEEIFAMWGATGAYKAAVRINSSGNLVFYDTTPTSKGTSSTALSADTWYRIEVKVGTGAGTGAYEVKINGTSEISGTDATLTNNNATIYFGKRNNRADQSVDFFYDDWALEDATYPADGACLLMLPDGDGTYTDWAIGAGSGSDYQQVDEVPHDGDTTYLVSSAQNQASSVTLESSSSAGISGTINAIFGFVISRRNATSGSVGVRLRSGTTNNDTSGDSTSTVQTIKRNIALTNPDGGGAWTTTALDSLEVGIVDKHASSVSRCTLMGVMVDFTASAGPTATRGRLSFAEFETPLKATRGRVSFTELEVPSLPTRGRVSFTELEVPLVSTRGRLSFTEMEVPLVPTRGRVSWAELEVPFIPTRGRLSFAELETPLGATRGRLSFSELEVPALATRGRVSWLEFSTPELGEITTRFKRHIMGRRGVVSRGERG